MLDLRAYQLGFRISLAQSIGRLYRYRKRQELINAVFAGVRSCEGVSADLTDTENDESAWKADLHVRGDIKATNV